MIRHRHGGADGFIVEVKISGPPPPRFTLLEKLVIWIGPPDRLNRLCNAYTYASCGAAMAYLILWSFWLHGAVVHTLSPSPGVLIFFSLAWTPLLVLQLFAGALRYTSFSLQLRGAEQASHATNERFLAAVSQCVSDTVQHHMDTREPDQQKPTLQ